MVKITDALKLRDDLTKNEAIEELKGASFNDIADELWRYYNFVLDIKSALEEREQTHATIIQEIVDIVNDSEYPEDLEENILEWLESKGVKV
jgi:hypothetical protein